MCAQQKEMLQLNRAYLATGQSLVDNLEDVVSPDNMQHQQDGEENVEDVVGRKHLDDLKQLYCKK